MGFNEVLHKADQTLRQELPLLPADFGFSWAGIEFGARLEECDHSADSGAEDPAAYRLTLSTELGHMPYTAENGEARRMIREAIMGGMRHMGVSFDLSRNGGVVMHATTNFPAPLSCDSLMQALTFTLLHIRPALLRLRSLMLRENGRRPARRLQGVGAS